jgi:mRNA interferase MazF
MVMQRGDIWWANLPDPIGSSPGFRRPVLLIQADAFTQSQIATVIILPLTSNRRLAGAPGNILLQAAESGLPRDSVVNVSQVMTLDKTDLTELIGRISPATLFQIEQGLRKVLDLW